MEEFAAREFCCIHPERMAMQHGCLDWTTLRPLGFRYYRLGLNSALATLANAHWSLLRPTGCSRRKLHRLPVCPEGGWRQVMARLGPDRPPHVGPVVGAKLRTTMRATQA